MWKLVLFAIRGTQDFLKGGTKVQEGEIKQHTKLLCKSL